MKSVAFEVGRFGWFYLWGPVYRWWTRLTFGLHMWRCGYDSDDIQSLALKMRDAAAGRLAALTVRERSAQRDGWAPAPSKLKL